MFLDRGPTLLSDVSKQLGHSTTRTTEKHYGWIRDRAAFLRLERAFSTQGTSGYAENDKPDAKKSPESKSEMGLMAMVDGGSVRICHDDYPVGHVSTSITAFPASNELKPFFFYFLALERSLCGVGRTYQVGLNEIPHTLLSVHTYVTITTHST